ncbi:hypothetical protein ACFQY0_19690 [Haloferula chungangensis]|uniref:Porin n=1 Tax=Haloferula chungangensis TaxID=1048331 RepID=A0ABW2LCZ2_9BACT
MSFHQHTALIVLLTAASLQAENLSEIEEDSPLDADKYSLADRIRLSLGGSLDVLGMTAFGSDGGDTALGTDFTLRLSKPILLPVVDETLSFHARVRYRSAIGPTAPSALGSEIGAAWGVVDGFNDAGFEVPDFYFSQLIPSKNIEIRYGQMVIDSQFDGQGVGGAKETFQNRAFSAHPAAAFPRLGAGLTIAWDPENAWDFAFGVTTVQGTASSEQVDFTFNSSDLFTVAQVGYEFRPKSEGLQRLQMAVWHSDAVETDDPNNVLGSGQGTSITYEYSLTPPDSENEITGFTRLAWASGSATDASFLLVSGAITDICPRNHIGLGAGIGRGEANKNWQGVIEAFYRYKFQKHGEVSLNAQLLAGQGFVDDSAIRMIIGAGARVSF